MKYLLAALVMLFAAASALAPTPARAQGGSCPYLEDVEINHNGECAGFVADGPVGAQQCAAIGGRLGPQTGTAGYAVPCFYRPVSATPPTRPQPVYQSPPPRPTPLPMQTARHPPKPSQEAEPSSPPSPDGDLDATSLIKQVMRGHPSHYANVPGLDASNCLSVQWNSARGDYALRNSCYYDVTADFCVIAPGTLFPCGDAASPGAHGALSFSTGELLDLGYIATKRGERLIQWMACKRDDQNAIAVLTEVEPPRGACMAWTDK